MVEFVNNDLVEFWNLLNRLGDHCGAKFGNAVIRNQEMIKKTIEELREAQDKRPEGLKKFDEERLKICLMYADTDDKGNPITVGADQDSQSFQITKRRDEFDVAVDHLRKKYELTFKVVARNVEEYNKMLGGKSKFNLIKVTLDQLPDTITIKQQRALRVMISDYDG